MRNTLIIMFSKIRVNGSQQEPLFKFLKSKRAGFLFLRRIYWNFTKFLVDKDGNVVRRFSPIAFPNLLRKHIDALID